MIFFRSFLTLNTCLLSFILENLTIIRLPFKRWQSSRLYLTTLQFRLSNISQTESFSWLRWTDEGNPTILTHYLREYWALAQHYLSICTYLSDKAVVLFFEIANFRFEFCKDRIKFSYLCNEISHIFLMLFTLNILLLSNGINSSLFNLLSASSENPGISVTVYRS